MIAFIITMVLMFLMATVATNSFLWAAGIVGFMLLFVLLPLVWVTVIFAVILAALFLFQHRL